MTYLIELPLFVERKTGYTHVEKCVEQRLSSEHQADLDALREEYETKIAQLNENYQHQTHTKVRNQLLGLAGYDVSNLRKQ